MNHPVVVRRALLSVSDKTGVVDLARALATRGVELLEAKVPGARALVARYKLDVSAAPETVDVSRTRDVLGWQCRHNFVTFLERLKTLDAAGTVAEQRCGY